MKPPVFNKNWPDDVKALYRHDMQEIWDNTIARQIWNQYHNQLNVYFSLIGENKSLKILDVGCAQGTLALLLAERGHKVWAMDIRQQFLDYAASRYEYGEIHFICGNATEIDMSEHFDMIFANQIIEHLIYPREFIKCLSQCLRPGGRLIVSTPNGEYLKNSLPSFTSLGEPSQYSHLQFSADGDGHFFAYTENELKTIFQKSGLSKIRLRFFETPWISGHMKIRYLHSFIPFRILKFLDSLTLQISGLEELLSHQILIEGSLLE